MITTEQIMEMSYKQYLDILESKMGKKLDYRISKSIKASFFAGMLATSTVLSECDKEQWLEVSAALTPFEIKHFLNKRNL